MLKMNYWTDKWDLHVNVCPCDVHFNEWVEARNRGEPCAHPVGLSVGTLSQ